MLLPSKIICADTEVAASERTNGWMKLTMRSTHLIFREEDNAVASLWSHEHLLIWVVILSP